jgi:outer membrane autotransporter protein
LYVDFAGALLPVSLAQLTGNAKSVGEYMFVSGFVPASADLVAVERQLIELEPQEFIDALISISPAQIGGLPLLEVENNFRLIESYKSRIQQFKKIHCGGSKSTKDCKAEVWIDPIGFGYLQRSIGQQYAFHANTYGFSVGGDALVADQFIVGVGGSYSHSDLHWFKNQGSAKLNSFYIGPFFGWQKNNFTIETAMLATLNLYSVDRNIHFPGLFRTASHKETGYNIVNSLSGDYLMIEPRSNFFIDPYADFVFVQSFHESFSETGAGSLSQNVNSKYTSFFRSDIGVVFGRDICINHKLAITPSILLGWMQTVPLAGRHYTANFNSVEMPDPNFTVGAYHTSPSQFHGGAGLSAKLREQTIVSAQYTISYGRHNVVQEVRMQLQHAF